MSGVEPDVQTVMEDCVRGSDEGRLTFPEVVKRLKEAGVERYTADLCRAEKTFYMPDGASHVVASRQHHRPPAEAFSPAAIDAALRAIQAQKIDYTTFCEQIAAAGCVSYLVSLAGRRAVYSGRTGETFVEPFPAGVK
ncbi:MAG: DUF1398 domain-containing protein [Beijerinckiaceae bacterium]|nr:MAG: DUF1398 domain-containing protein [Beijerinckiaceae bacterium]